MRLFCVGNLAVYEGEGVEMMLSVIIDHQTHKGLHAVVALG